VLSKFISFVDVCLPRLSAAEGFARIVRRWSLFDASHHPPLARIEMCLRLNFCRIEALLFALRPLLGRGENLGHSL
jgi:hypothetical protein